MSTKDLRMVRVPVTLDVQVGRWCRARDVDPHELTPDVRRYIHELIRADLRDNTMVTMREEPGAAPHTTCDIHIPRASLQDIWDQLLADEELARRARDDHPAAAAVTILTAVEVRRNMYADMMGLGKVEVYEALRSRRTDPLVWPGPLEP